MTVLDVEDAIGTWPDVFPADWIDQDAKHDADEDACDEDDLWRLRFEWLGQRFDSDPYPLERVLRIKKLWSRRPRRGRLRVNMGSHVEIVPMRQIKSVEIVR